jgi:hypothetical protein
MILADSVDEVARVIAALSLVFAVASFVVMMYRGRRRVAMHLRSHDDPGLDLDRDVVDLAVQALGRGATIETFTFTVTDRIKRPYPRRFSFTHGCVPLPEQPLFQKEPLWLRKSLAENEYRFYRFRIFASETDLTAVEIRAKLKIGGKRLRVRTNRVKVTPLQVVP